MEPNCGWTLDRGQGPVVQVVSMVVENEGHAMSPMQRRWICCFKISGVPLAPLPSLFL
jgi:hypothetical protein